MKDDDCYRAVRNVLTGLNYPLEHVDQALKVLSGEIDLTNKPLLSPRQLCRLLGISRTTLWRMQLPAITVGRCKRYDMDVVMARLAHNVDGRPVKPREAVKLPTREGGNSL